LFSACLAPGVLANAPSLLTSLRNNRNAHQSPPAKATTKTEP